MRHSLLTLLLLVVNAAWAAPVTGVGCDVPGVSQSGDSACSLAGPNGLPIAKADASLTFTTFSDPAQFSTLNLHLDVLATGDENFQTGQKFGGSASAVSNYTRAFQTAGPLRSGFLLLQTSAFYDRTYLDGGFLTLGFQGPSGFGHTTQISCSQSQSDCDLQANQLNHFSPYPVTLGSSLTLQLFAEIYASPDIIYNQQSGGSVDAAYGFRFVEADGVTPVPFTGVAAAPEPLSLGLTIMAGLVGSVSWLVRRQARYFIGNALS